MPDAALREQLNALRAAAARETERMRADPRPLDRPVVVLGGWRAWSLNASTLARRLASLTSGHADDFLTVSFLFHGRLDTAADVARRRIAQRWPGGGAEIDAVGVSMGGLVARLVHAHAGAGGESVRVRRLFTLATPHRGSRLAAVVALDHAARDMRPGSARLRGLDDALRSDPLEIVPYARLYDVMVGARNAAPPDDHPRWIAGPRLLSHVLVTTERIFVADIALRLRGETPLDIPCSPPPRH